MEWPDLPLDECTETAYVQSHVIAFGVSDGGFIMQCNLRIIG